MTYKEIQKKLEKCESALTSIQNGTYTNGKLSEKEALKKITTIKESLEKKLNLLKEEETMFVSTKGGDTKAVSMDTKAAMDLKKDPNITGITTAKGKDLKEDDLSDEEQEEITTETSHTEVVAKEVHKALIDALQDTGHEVSQDDISSLNPETFTISIRFKDNTQSDYSFEFVNGEIKLDGNIIVTANKKGITPVLNKTIAKNNLVKYFQNLTEKKGKDLDGDGDVDSDDYLLAKDKAIKANMKEEESEPVADKKGKYTGVRRLKLSAKDKETLKKIEDLLAKEKNENINEENYDYYTKPKHFDICPGAEALRDEVLASGKTPEELGEWTFKHDELFRLEKAVLKANKADERHIKVAKQLAGEITHHSRDLGIEANKIGYLKGHIKKIQDIADKTDGRGDNMSLRSRDIYEGEGDVHHYIKVPRREYKKAMSILDQNVDPTYVKMDTVDYDGAGNVIIYFIFRHEYGFDDMYDDPEGKENPELYQEPDEDPSGFMYDVVMDLRANDITVVDSSAKIDENYDPDQEQLDDEDEIFMPVDDEGRPLGETDEARDINDPALVKYRVAKMRADDMKKLDAYKKSPEGRAAARSQASAERKEKQARALVQKLKAKRAEIEREMENDPDIEPTGGPVADMYGDQLNKIDNAIEKTASVYNKPMDYDTAVGKVTEEDKMKEHISVGHPDNEPGMLKQDAHDIAHYAVKLYKLLKYYESLEDQVDFPHWWQSKVVKAREYISKAAHYLEFKTNEPAIDAQVGALQEDEEPTKADMAKEKSLAKKAALLQFIASMQQKGILDKDNKVLDKDAYKKAFDDFKKNVKEGRILNELSTDQRNDLVELQNILDDAASLGEQARDIIRQSFPNMLSKADAYGVFNFGSSANRYNTTLESIIEEIEEYYDEEEDLDEIGMFHDPIGYEKSEPETPVFTKKYVGKDAYHILKNGKKLMTLFGSEGEANAYVNKRNKEVWTGEGKYKSDAQRKAIYATKAEKGNLKEEMDGGRLFDYFKSKGYDITERRPDGYPAKEGVEGYMVSRGEGRAPQSVIFQHNKDTDEFTISRMSGYRIDQKDAIKAGMKQAGRSGVAGIDSYMTDGNYTPVGISAKGLKDIVDHVMSGLDREAKAQADFYGARGSTSGTIDEGATCCGRCGRVHVKGSGCKRPYLKGKDHCRTK